jgi:hypothetical protein
MTLAPRILLPVFLSPLGSAAPVAQQEKPPSTVERSDPEGKLRLRLEETQICILDPGMNQDSFVASPDGHHIAYMAMAGQGLCVYSDGKKGENFEGLAFGSILFSPNGEHLGYVGTRPAKQCVVLDDKMYEYEGVSKQGVVFSPDGKRYGWVAAREGNQFAVIDGEESPPYEGVSSLGVLFSPDSKVSAYVGTSGGKQLVIANGEEGPLYDSIGGLKFSQHGSRLVYMGVRGSEWYAVVDTTPYGPFRQAALHGAEVRRGRGRGGRVRAVAGRRAGGIRRPARQGLVRRHRRQGARPLPGLRGPHLQPGRLALGLPREPRRGWFPVVDGEEIHGHLHQALSFSPDGKHLALVIRRGDKQLTLIDGTESKPYDRIEEPGVLFSADGTKSAYIASLGTESYVVVNGVESPPFRRPGKTPLAFSPHGASVIYSIRRGEQEIVIVDGVEGPPVTSIRTLTFSPDGSRYAYAAEKAGGWTVVVDGVEHGADGVFEDGKGRPYQQLGKRTPVFSPDGKRVAYSAFRDNRWVVVADGVEGKDYGLVMRATVDFTPDSAHLVYIAADALDTDHPHRFIVVDGVEIENGWSGFLYGPTSSSTVRTASASAARAIHAACCSRSRSRPVCLRLIQRRSERAHVAREPLERAGEVRPVHHGVEDLSRLAAHRR